MEDSYLLQKIKCSKDYLLAEMNHLYVEKLRN